MKKTILIIFSVLIWSACQEKQVGLSTRHTHQTNHEYGEIEKKDQKSLNPFSNSRTEKNRWVWQKPELVINELGDLKDKIVVDLGAGPYGYFSAFITEKTTAKKVIALDISSQAIDFIEGAKMFLSEDNRHKLETRLVKADDPMLTPNEADIVLIVNTVTYFSHPVNYLSNLARGIKPGGKLVIVDFKKHSTPIGPDVSQRLAIGELEIQLKKAGYQNIQFNDCTLDYQYIVTAYK